jgi:NadR type nicotinamide-nucleotide adenylyltransferase
MLKRIVLYGPESTGKSTLAEQLAKHYHTLWAPEFARGYLDFKREVYDPFGRKSNEICQPQDIPHIVIGQIVQEEALQQQANRFLFCDTNPLQTKIYNLYYYHRIDDWLEKVIKERTYDHYLLMDIDIPWEPDPLRDRPEPEDRLKLFNMFKEELDAHQFPYSIIKGTESKRLEQAIKIVDTL